MLAYQQELGRMVDRAEREGRALISEAERSFRKDSYSDALRAVMRRLSRAFDDIFGGRDARRIIDKARNQTDAFNRRDLARVLSIDVPEFDVDGVGRAWTRDNVSLVKSIPRELHAQLDEMIALSASNGSDVSVVVRRIQERFGVAKSRARIIGRDQVLTLNGDLTKKRHRELGIREYEWNSSSDERVRSHHSRLDGQRFAWADPPVGGGSTPSERGHPGTGILCRCVAIPVMPND